MLSQWSVHNSVENLKGGKSECSENTPSLERMNYSETNKRVHLLWLMQFSERLCMILSILSTFHIESLDLFEPSCISLNSAEGFKRLQIPISDLDSGSLEKDSHANV